MVIVAVLFFIQSPIFSRSNFLHQCYSSSLSISLHYAYYPETDPWIIELKNKEKNKVVYKIYLLQRTDFGYFHLFAITSDYKKESELCCHSLLLETLLLYVPTKHPKRKTLSIGGCDAEDRYLIHFFSGHCFFIMSSS